MYQEISDSDSEISDEDLVVGWWTQVDCCDKEALYEIVMGDEDFTSSPDYDPTFYSAVHLLESRKKPWAKLLLSTLCLDFLSTLNSEKEYRNDVACDLVDELLYYYYEALVGREPNGLEKITSRLETARPRKLSCEMEALSLKNSV